MGKMVRLVFFIFLSLISSSFLISEQRLYANNITLPVTMVGIFDIDGRKEKLTFHLEPKKNDEPYLRKVCFPGELKKLSVFIGEVVDPDFIAIKISGKLVPRYPTISCREEGFFFENTSKFFEQEVFCEE